MFQQGLSRKPGAVAALLQASSQDMEALSSWNFTQISSLFISQIRLRLSFQRLHGSLTTCLAVFCSAESGEWGSVATLHPQSADTEGCVRGSPEWTSLLAIFAGSEAVLIVTVVVFALTAEALSGRPLYCPQQTCLTEVAKRRPHLIYTLSCSHSASLRSSF